MSYECDDWNVIGYPGEFVYGDDGHVSDYYMDERWMPIHSFPGYWISNKARVYSTIGRRFLTSRLDKGRHEYVELRRDGKTYVRYVHHLMGDAFIPNPNKYKMIRHLNDIPYDNDIYNLAWGDHWLNMQDSIRNGSAVCLRNRIPVKAIDLITGQEYVFESLIEASRQLGVHAPAIGQVLRGRYHHANGYAFMYLDDEQMPTVTVRTSIRYAKIRAINRKTGETSIYKSQKEAGEKLGIPSQSINLVLKGRRPQTHGYTFEYVFERD